MTGPLPFPVSSIRQENVDGDQIEGIPFLRAPIGGELGIGGLVDLDNILGMQDGNRPGPGQKYGGLF